MASRFSDRLLVLALTGATLLASSGCVCLSGAPEADGDCRETFGWDALFGNHAEDLSNQGAGSGEGGEDGGGEGTTPE
ncbi:MAG TPA: hypothetical protein VFT98_09940 [Myxococcota bacterium]|nr:hypothetical protein [Myxococcota bacterium]